MPTAAGEAAAAAAATTVGATPTSLSGLAGTATTTAKGAATATGDAGEVGDACDVSDGCVSDAGDETAETAEAVETAEENILSLGDRQLLNATKKLSQQQQQGLLQIDAHQSSVPPGELRAQYWGTGEKPDAAATEKLKALDGNQFSVIFTRDQLLVPAAMREAAEAMVRKRQALSPADPGVSKQAFKQLVDEQLKQLVAQLVASAKSVTGDLLQYACAAAAGKPASKVVGVSLRRDGDGRLAFADGFEDDFFDVQELIDRAEKTGPAMLALVLGSCVLRLSPIEVANALLSGDATGHGITMCDLAAGTLKKSKLQPSQLAAIGFEPAKVLNRNGSGATASCYNFVSVTIGTLYLYLNISGKGGKMKHKENACICLLVLLGFLHFGIISMTPQSEPSGIIVLVVVCSSSSSSSMSKRSSSPTTTRTTSVITTTQALH